MMQKILILGGGFAGIRAGLELARHSGHEITLVSDRDAHVYNADLYEIATAFSPKITEECLTELRDTVATPLQKIFDKKPVQIIKDKVLKINAEEKTVELKQNGKIAYDYLIVALGSVTNYYGNETLKQFSYPLKTLQDALAISCHLDSYFQNLWKKEQKKKVSIMIGGGGFTGVEFACELTGFLNKICKKYNFPRERVEIGLIQAAPELGGQGPEISNLITQRLEKSGVQIYLNTKIKDVEINKLHIEDHKGNKKNLDMDTLIWTGGVMPNPLIRESFSEVAKNGALPVNEFLQNPKYPNIYAAGDCSSIIDQPAPMLAQVADEEAKIIVHNILAEIQHTEKKKYQLHLKGMIIPLGGKYAIFKTGNFIFKGFWSWIFRKIVDLKYALSILPWPYAIKKWFHSGKIFVEND